LLGVAIVSYVNIFNPDAVILHGGLVNAGEMLLDPLKAKVEELCFEASLKDLRILPSALKGDAGIVGAAGLAFARAEDIP
ncbi:MAG: ROK family protein, partial [Planctomycetota bacterium]